MSIRAPWVHTSPSQPCPICSRAKRGNRCILIPDHVVLCFYVLSDRPRKTAAGDAWLHFLKGKRASFSRRPAPKPAVSADANARAPKRNDLHILAAKFRSRCSDARLQSLSRQLGLSIDALLLLETGWSDGEMMETARGPRRIYAWSFPIRNALGEVVGFRMRSTNGGKFAFTGGSGGLFIPRGFNSSRAFLFEGPTDTAAGLDLGLNAFGRESSSAGADTIVAVLKKFGVRQLVIFSQRDIVHERVKGRADLGVYYPAQDGAAALAPRVRLYCQDVRVIMPPAIWPDRKVDVRDWLHAGATSADVEQLVAAEKPIQLKVITSKPSETLSLEGASTK